MDQIRAVILDFDGTLFNNITAMKAATEDALKRYEVDYDAEMALTETTRLIEKIRSSALSKILLKAWELLSEVEYLEGRKFLEKAEIAFYAYTLYKDYSKQCTLFSGVPELLRNMKSQYKIAIVTSGSRADTTELLKEFGIFQYIDAFISADDVENTKPHPEGILKILDTLQISPNEAVYVGDLPLDIKAGKNAEVKTIAVSTGLVPRGDLEAEEPSKVVRHVTEISTLIPGIAPTSVDIDADLAKTIEERREFVPKSEEKKVSFSDRLKSISIDELKELLKQPYQFIREKLNEMLEESSAGNIQEALTVFEGVEEDLLRVVGLIGLHALNERLGDVLFKLFQTEYGSYLGYLNYEFIEQTTMTVLPDEVFDEIKIMLIAIARDLLPEAVYDQLLNMAPFDFISYIFEGVRLAMMDLGMEIFEIREFIGDKFSDDEMNAIEFIWALIKTLFTITLNALSIPMKLVIKHNTPVIKDAIQLTLDSFSRSLETINTNLLEKSEKFGKFGELLQKIIPKEEEADENLDDAP
ncbi:MAG: HAD family hydrolase [Candidatus Helarchaeota archaeon]|nr:HAD family hydrolase [Candidatus Helarchaeota archaeon]